MACGRPVICSTRPLQGLAVEPGVHLLKADTCDEWVASISRVFSDKQLQHELGVAGVNWVRANYSWDTALAMLNELQIPE